MDAATGAQRLDVSTSRRLEGDPNYLRPLFQWQALFALDDLEIAFAEGDDRAVLRAVFECALNDLMIPRWAAQAFVNSYRKVALHEVATWDEAFGRAVPKGKHLAEARQRLLLMPKVFLKAKALINDGTPVDDGLFETIAEEFGIGKTLAKSLYYDFKHSSEAAVSPGTLIHQLLAPLKPRKSAIVRKFPGKRKG